MSRKIRARAEARARARARVRAEVGVRAEAEAGARVRARYMRMKNLNFIFSILLFSFATLYCDETMTLRDNLPLAQKGDFIVISAGKTETLLNIVDKQNTTITIEEIAIPEQIRKSYKMPWKQWALQGAPGNTSWVIYDIDLTNGKMARYYSFSKQGWFEIPEADNFLSKLLTLKLYKIPENERKMMGPKPTTGPDWRKIWQPTLIFDGKKVDGVTFDAWRTVWPKDKSDLSGKTIDVYLPKSGENYPSYFPYWLQVSGVVGKAKVRIIDSGNKLDTQKKFPQG